MYIHTTNLIPSYIVIVCQPLAKKKNTIYAIYIQTTAKVAPAGGAEGSASQKGLPQNWKDKEEAMMRELKELKQVQQWEAFSCYVLV